MGIIVILAIAGCFASIVFIEKTPAEIMIEKEREKDYLLRNDVSMNLH